MTAVPVVQRFPTRLVADATGAAMRSVERWRLGVRPRRTAYVHRLSALEAVLELLGPAMTDRGKTAWLTSASAYLNGRRPVDVIASGDAPRAMSAAQAYAAGDVT